MSRIGELFLCVSELYKFITKNYYICDQNSLPKLITKGTIFVTKIHYQNITHFLIKIPSIHLIPIDVNIVTELMKHPLYKLYMGRKNVAICDKNILHKDGHEITLYYYFLSENFHN